jgi:riboflavin biosynthesis pyrimidine reductase
MAGITANICRVGACLASSVDGRIWHPEIPVLGSDSDRYVLESLRAQADVLLYGAGTARADSQQRIEFRCPDVARTVTGVPPIAVLSRSVDFDFSAPFWNSDCPTAILHVGAVPGLRPPRLPSEIGYLAVPASGGPAKLADLPAALRAVSEWVQRMHPDSMTNESVRVLCEGGGQLVGSLMRHALLDELFLTVTPWVLGDDGIPGISGHLIPVRLGLVELHTGITGEIFARYRRDGALSWPRLEMRPVVPGEAISVPH